MVFSNNLEPASLQQASYFPLTMKYPSAWIATLGIIKFANIALLEAQMRHIHQSGLRLLES
jgi:hypothetical protein